MGDIPRSVLSEHFQARMESKRLLSAVFLTFRLDPGFFEQDILPVFLDIPTSHAASIRLVQIEDELRALRGDIAVYYDAGGLISENADSAKLDIRRIPVRHRTGYFHPKNVFLLVEDKKIQEGQIPSQSLLVASLSANLTRAGWWENVEVCHVEEIMDGEKTRLRDDLIYFLESVRRKVPKHNDAAIRAIIEFLRKKVVSRSQRTSKGWFNTHFYSGRETIPDFLERVAGKELHGKYLEVISPYFDDANESKPLRDLIERFNPREIRIFLPISSSGEALCKRELYKSVSELSDFNITWGHLPKEVTRMGKSEDAGKRFVHAKVYRFFCQNPKREYLFVGSPNLTMAAHHSGGNVESGFFVENAPPKRPDFWLISYTKTPSEFLIKTEDEGNDISSDLTLNIRYHWDTKVAEAYWDSTSEPPPITLSSHGVEIGVIRPSLRTWKKLSIEISSKIEEALQTSSFISVSANGIQPTRILVQEEGMSHKPCLLLKLSVSDILRYWALLTPEQRSAFIETHSAEIGITGQGAELLPSIVSLVKKDTLFDRFAGYFHSFNRLENVVRESLDIGKKGEKEAVYRLFGEKYDSLGTLLYRLLAEGDDRDDVDRYVIVMCAKQLLEIIKTEYEDFWSNHKKDIRRLEDILNQSMVIRDKLIGKAPDSMLKFLEWFDIWFLKKAEPLEDPS